MHQGELSLPCITLSDFVSPTAQLSGSAIAHIVNDYWLNLSGGISIRDYDGAGGDAEYGADPDHINDNK